MLAWCLTPFLSSITNGLGYWDGMSVVLEQLALYGIPYFIGRRLLQRLGRLPRAGDRHLPRRA